MYDKGEIIRLKELTPMAELLINLGFEKINQRTQRAACRLHGGRNKSSFCWREDFFNCFSCNKCGDKITLVRLVKGYDFKQAINYLSGLTGYQLRSTYNFHKRNYNNENIEIPQYIVDMVEKQDFDLIQINSIIEKIEAEIEMYTEIICSLRKERSIIPDYYQLIEKRLYKLDSDLCYWIFERNQILKNKYSKNLKYMYLKV